MFRMPVFREIAAWRQSEWSAGAVRISKRLSVRGLIGLCFGLLVLSLIGGSWLLLERTRQTALHAADATLQNATLIVEGVVNRELLQVDGALVSLPALFAAAANNEQDVDTQLGGRLLRQLNFQTFAFRDIIMVRPDGGIWASARGNPWNGKFPDNLLGLGTASRSGAAIVAGPTRNPVTGEWVLLIARRVLVPGVGPLDAVAEVPLPFISELLSAVGETPGLRVSLERRDGRLLVSQPYDEVQIGKQQRATIGKIKTSGTHFDTTKDGVPDPKIGIIRPILYGDIVIVMTLDLKTAMTDWVSDRNRRIISAGVMIALVSALALVLNSAFGQRERAEAERRKARETLDSAIESMSDGFVMWDSENRLITCNAQYRRMYAISADLISPGVHIGDLVRGGAERGQYPQVTGDIEEFVSDTVAWHCNNDGPKERELPDHSWILVSERRTPAGAFVGIRTDITDLKRALSNLEAANNLARQAVEEVQLQNVALQQRDRELHIQNVLFDAALNNMSQGLLMTDHNHRLIVCNKRFLNLFAIDPTSFSTGISTNDIFAIIKASGRFSAEAVVNTQLGQRSLADARQSGTFTVMDENGLSIAVSQRPIADGGWVATYEDVSEQRRADEHIRYAAHHDDLTKLPNRVLFHVRLNEMIADVACRDTGLALLYLDLDRFKHVNDTLGHPIGDALLEAAGRRLLGCVRESDIVARLSGDEFAIACVSPGLPLAAQQLGKRVIDALSKPYNLDGHTVVVGASIGIALAGAGQTDADTLLKNADMALYQSKAKGRGICSLFEADMATQLLGRLAIEEDLRGAVDRQEFELLYQPLYDMSNDRIAGYEALIRWNHPTRGTVSPYHFIQIAEETGLIHQIGEWVVNRACADAMKLPHDVKVAVNLSGTQFDSGDIVAIVAAALNASGLPANRLELEITETTLLKNNERTLALLVQLHALGLRIALDDFGTGYSSLSYLLSFPFDKIKIDQSFVREMATRKDCAVIINSIVALANQLNITTTAEGIETLDQLKLIRETGCTEAQGYLFSVPRPLQDVIDFFATSSDSTAEINA